MKSNVCLPEHSLTSRVNKRKLVALPLFRPLHISRFDTRLYKYHVSRRERRNFLKITSSEAT